MSNDADRIGGCAAGTNNLHAVYRAAATTVHRVDDHLTLLTSDLWHGVVPVETAALTVLRCCQQERTLDAHANYAARELHVDTEAVLETLTGLVARGLLRAVADMPRDSPRYPPSSTPLDCLAIVTADRPARLERCLTSYVDYIRARHLRLRVLVVDGSCGREHREATERCVEVVSRSRGVAIEYQGADARLIQRQNAHTRGVQRSTMDWLMPEAPTWRGAGATRNQLLLATAGERVLTVDDDTVCRPWRPADAASGSALIGHVDPNDTKTFPTRAEAVADALTTSGDLLAGHEALLGSPLATFAGSPGTKRHLDDVCRHLLPVLDGMRPAWRVRATWSGLAGDAGTYCPYRLLFATGPTRDRLASAENRFRLAFFSREVVRSVRCATVTDEPWFMGYCATLDNTALLPPFVPFGTNEDGLFGAMLRMCDPNAFIGQVPVGIVHDSARGPTYDDRRIPSASDLRITDVLLQLSRMYTDGCVSAVPEERLRGLGRHLIECGRLEVRAWRALLTRLGVEAKRRLLVAADSTLASGFPYPVYWRAALRRYQQAVLESLLSPTFYVPVDYQTCSTIDQSLARFQADVAAFGEALIAWPDVWEMGRQHVASHTNARPL